MAFLDLLKFPLHKNDLQKKFHKWQFEYCIKVGTIIIRLSINSSPILPHPTAPPSFPTKQFTKMSSVFAGYIPKSAHSMAK